jgi:predicted permease
MLIAIVVAIAVSVWAGIDAERRRPGRAGVGSRRALTLVLYTVLPFVVFFNLVHVELDRDLLGGVGVALLAVAICAVAALAAGRALRLRDDQTGALVTCVLIANTGYLGYPLVAALLGIDRLSEAVAYDVGVGTVALLIGGFGVGAALGTDAGDGPRERVGSFFARNAPLYAAAAALVAPASLAPDLLVDLSRLSIALLLPVGFFAVGAALAEDAADGAVPLPPPLERPTLVVIAIKLVLLPGLLLALAAPLIDLPGTFLLLAAMPSGLNSMIVAHTYGLDLRLTAEAVSWTTAIVIAGAIAGSIAL